MVTKRLVVAAVKKKAAMVPTNLTYFSEKGEREEKRSKQAHAPFRDQEIRTQY